ncbi:MAG: DUF4286 family protein [Chitinophagaceae bacterium]|nr:MAG: DUF4286 family protein [Chitinophagaceae bacterium]
MFVYNVTIKVDHDITEEWLTWMQKKHIPDVMNTECFQGFKLCKLIMPSPDNEGVSYAVQYFFKEMKDLHIYQSKFAAKLQEEHASKYKDKFVAFRTVLEELDEV